MPGRACVLAFISFVSSSRSFALHFRHAGNVRPNYISSGQNNLDSRDDCQADQFYADTIFAVLLIIALMAGRPVCSAQGKSGRARRCECMDERMEISAPCNT